MSTTIEDIQQEEAEEQQSKDQELEEKITEALQKAQREGGVIFKEKDIDNELQRVSALDDHRDRAQDRKLRENWSRDILKGLYIYGGFNYLILVLYGIGWLKFSNVSVLNIFMGGSVITIPTIAIYITQSLFPAKKK